MSETFDLVLLDPPYVNEQIVENLELLQDKKRLTEKASVVRETDKGVELPDHIGKLELTRQKTYGICVIAVNPHEKINSRISQAERTKK